MNNIVLTLTLVLSLGACGDNALENNGDAKQKTAQSEKRNRVEVLYFHGRQRCATCMAIEKNAKEAVRTGHSFSRLLISLRKKTRPSQTSTK